MKNLPWSRYSDEQGDDDLCAKTEQGYWDLVHGVDGWVLYTPTAAGNYPIDRPRHVLGHITRDEGKKFAEDLYAKQNA